MFAIAFDLDCAATRANHPKTLSQAYSDIGNLLIKRGFRWEQGSLYLTDDESMANLLSSILELRAPPWFLASVRDIRAFRVEQWLDFTALVKEGPGVASKR